MTTTIETSESSLNLDIKDEEHLRAQARATQRSELPKGYYTSTRVLCTLGGLSLSLIANYFAFEASAAAASDINADIGPSQNFSLLSTIWSISQALSTLLMGRLTDRFGRRNYVLGTNVLAVIGFIVAATARQFNTLIGGQVLLGLAAGQSAAIPLLVGELMSNETKFLGTVIVSAPNVLATGFGPYLGVRLGHEGRWRWIFYISLIMQVITTVDFWVYYYPPSFIQIHGKKITKWEEVKRTDWIGILLVSAGMSIFLLGISWGGSPLPWTSSQILGLLISGAVLLVAFVIHECYTKVACPLIPVALFRDVRGFLCLLIVGAVFGTLNVSLFILYPQQIKYIFGPVLSSWEDTAWMSSTAAFSIWGGIMVFGSLFHLIRHIKWQLLFASIWTSAFLAAMTTVNANAQGTAIALTLCTGIFIGWAQDVVMLLCQFISKDNELGVAYSIVASMRSFCGSIFSAAFVAIYTSKVPGELQKKLVPAVLSAGLPSSSIGSLLTAVSSGDQQTIAAVPGMTSELLALTNDRTANSYAASFSYVYYFSMALGIIAIIGAICMKDFDCYMTDHVPHQIYRSKETTIDPLENQYQNEIKETGDEKLGPHAIA